MVDKLRLSSPKASTDHGRAMWLNELYERIGEGPFMIRGYTIASTPSASEWGDGVAFSSLIFVSDETGGATLAFSDGTNWRRVQDRSIIA